MSAVEISDLFRDLQNRICAGLESLDGRVRFHQDTWNRPGGGGGRTRVIRDGNLFEKGGVNFSAVHGPAPEFLKKESGIASDNFFATGVSIVLHPLSPMVPIIHMNVRYLEVGGTFWFGGGIDLTPVYVVPADAGYFHRQLKEVCDTFNPVYYPEFRKWADEYFYITHRNETRGIGGIFFDRLKPDASMSAEQLLAFVMAVGNSFVPVYSEIVRRNRDLNFGDQEKNWQYLRRGRYAEFNLVYDRGTRFGLETDGRTESILMSLPPMASWIYDFRTQPGSPEEQTQQLLRKGIDWIHPAT